MRRLVRWLMGLLLLTGFADMRAYTDGARIVWNYGGSEFVNSGVYVRVKKLSNGESALVYSEGPNVYIRKKTVLAEPWGTPVRVTNAPSGYNYMNVELIEQVYGTLIYACHARPWVEGGELNYKIMIAFSEDRGLTRKNERDIYAADDNWHSGTVGGNGSERWNVLTPNCRLGSNLYAGAPYLIQRTDKTTLLSIQSSEDRENSDCAVMQVYIGNEEARNFSRKSTPFPWLPARANALWNTLCQIADSTLLAVTSVGGLERNNGIWTATGRLMEPLFSERADESVGYPSSVFIGSLSQTNARIGSEWDPDSRQFGFVVKDTDIRDGESGTELTDAGGIEIFLDMKNWNSETILSGLFSLRVNCAGQIVYRTSAGDEGTALNPSAAFTGTTETGGYRVRIAVS